MIVAENLCKTYGTGEGAVNALCNVDLTIEDGEFVAIVGKKRKWKIHAAFTCLAVLTV